MTEKRSTPLENAELPDNSVEHLHGPEGVDYAEDELMVVCLVRDGRPYVKSFVEHYRSLGARHIAFLDNGSTDGTVEALSEYDAVTVQRTGLPYKDYKHALKRYLIFNFGQRARWCLCADMDELFDYPYSDVIGLNSFLAYLNSKSYTALAAQMLDMFPEEPLSGRSGGADEPLKERHRFYDISNIKKRSMRERARLHGNTLDSEDVEAFSGGIRDTVFGSRPILTKRAMVFLDGKVRPMDGGDHMVGNAKIADVTGVFLHYKFLDEHFHERVEMAVREENYTRNSAKYKMYKEVLDRDPSLRLMKRGISRELRDVNDLIRDKFLVVSDDYVRWVNAEEEKGANTRDGAILEARRRGRIRDLEMQKLEHQLRENGPPFLLDSEKREKEGRQRKRVRAQSRKIKRLEHQLRENRRLVRQARDLKRQLNAIRSSRPQRLMARLRRIKTRLVGGRKGAS